MNVAQSNHRGRTQIFALRRATWLLIWVGLTWGLLPVTASLADDQTRTGPSIGPFSITPMIGYRDGGRFDVPDSDEPGRLDGGASAGAVLAYELEPGSYYEFTVLHQASTVAVADFDVDITHVLFGGRIDWHRPQLIPFLSAGLGATHINARDSGLGSMLRPGFSIAGGIEWPLGARVAIRTEARGNFTLTGGDRQIFCVSEPGDAFCHLAWDGSVLSQFELLAGLTFRF